jgi:hypothetical protein|tara:strand:- start:378 stop:1004 length:627 start_codon:yes stop_codon:yes gene_type:complete
MQIHINSFVKRQTSNSSYSHFEDVNKDDENWELLGSLIEANFDKAKEGYRKEVLLVPVPSNSSGDCGRSEAVLEHCFYSGVAQLEDGEMFGGRFESRKEGETPRQHITAIRGDSKIPAKSVQIVLYSSTVLAEDGDNELPPEEGNWEVISINASPTEGEMPINPNTLMHNHFGSDGGTDTKLSDSEFVAMLKTSFEYWKDKVMAAEPN